MVAQPHGSPDSDDARLTIVLREVALCPIQTGLSSLHAVNSCISVPLINPVLTPPFRNHSSRLLCGGWVAVPLLTLSSAVYIFGVQIPKILALRKIFLQPILSPMWGIPRDLGEIVPHLARIFPHVARQWPKAAM